MKLYYRYFRTTGPLVEDAKRLQQLESRHVQALIALGDELGAEVKVYSDGRLAGFEFPRGAQVNDRAWRQPDRGTKLRWPKVRTAEGRAIHQKIDDLPERHTVREALYSVGLGGLMLIGSMNGSRAVGYQASLCGSYDEGVFFVQVPWASVTKAEMDEYDAAENTFNANMASLKWTPPEELEEIEHWQFVKETEELGL